MELRFPRASRSLHLPSIPILPSISEAYFWLVVVWKIINQLLRVQLCGNFIIGDGCVHF